MQHGWNDHKILNSQVLENIENKIKKKDNIKSYKIYIYIYKKEKKKYGFGFEAEKKFFKKVAFTPSLHQACWLLIPDAKPTNI